MIGGEIGRRIDVIARSSFLALDPDQDFLAPFCARSDRGVQ